MNFFERQARARRASVLLLLAFTVAMALAGLLVHTLTAGLSLLTGHSERFWQLTEPGLAMTAVLWSVILLGCLFRWLDVRAGGAVLARRFGGVQASDRRRHVDERRLMNVVAEMSIAAGLVQPDVFVLRSEPNINAFIVGSSEDDRALVVTKGALDHLDRDELQAVVAHEFAHVVQGDLPINMRLLVALGGLNAIHEVGDLLNAGHADELFHPLMLLGKPLRLVGSVGTLGGRLVRAAFSRQRELLADATAVQFTRNAYAMASALAAIEAHDDDRGLHSRHGEELEPLCFHAGVSLGWFRRLFASHPTIAERIQAIEPHFEVKQRRRKSRAREPGSTSNTTSTSLPAQLATVVPLATNRSKQASSPVNHQPVSDRIVLLLGDEKMAFAALFALFAPRDAHQRRDYLSALIFSVGETFAANVQTVVDTLPAELAEDPLGIIAHASELISARVSLENRRALLVKLEQVLGVNREFPLMHYATLQLIRRKLQIEFPIVDAVASTRRSTANCGRVKSFDAMGREFALLLSLMVESSGAPPAELEAQFQRVLRCYTKASHPRRSAREPGIVEELESAFQTLYVQPESIRKAFVQHCIEIMQHDGHAARAERTLLSLFAAALDCEEMAA